MAQTCPSNIDFEKGIFDGWTCYAGYVFNQSGSNVMNLNPVQPQPDRHVMYTASSGGERDPYGNFPVNCPNGSGHSIRLGNSSGGHEADGIAYEFTIPAGENNYRLIYHYAVVFQQPRHEEYEQPRMEIEVKNITDNSIISCASFTFIAYGTTLPGFHESQNTFDSIPVLYKDWTAVSIDLSGNAGKQIRIFFKTADCTFNRHFGYAYIDVNSECDGKITGADYCLDDTAINVVAPYGYQDYKWYDERQTQLLGTGQILTLMPPPAPNTTLAVRLSPYAGFGCPQTILVNLNNTLTISARAGPDTIACNYRAVQIGSPPKPGLVYAWAPSAGLNNPGIANPFANPAKTTAYTLTVRSSGGGCLQKDTVVVKASVLNDSMRILGKQMYCIGSGDSTVLLVEPTTSIQWFKDNREIAGANKPAYKVDSTGTYFARLRNADGCMLPTVPKTVTISTVPVAGFSADTLKQCLVGNRFIFSNSSTNQVGAMQYRWTLGNGITLTSRDLNFSYPNAGRYQVNLVVSSSPVCADTVTTQVEVYQNAIADFDIKPSCIDLPVQITNNTVDTMASRVNYVWTLGNGQVSNVRNPMPPVFSKPGSYEVSLSVNTAQCSSPYNTLRRTLVIDKPLANIAYPVKYALISTPLRLKARSIGETVLWTPGISLDNPTSYTPLFTGAVERQYTIKLTTASGCITVDTQLVRTVKEVMIFVPTAFTPNNDGKNDYLRPVLMGIKQLRYFKVFNRWGQLMYQTTDEERGWNGVFRGIPQNAQAYVWMVEAVGVDNKTYTKKGTSILLK